MVIEKLAPVMAGLEAIGLNRHWKPIPEEKMHGHTWARVEPCDDRVGKKTTMLCDNATGDLYNNDTQDWALVKDIGYIAFGKYAYGVAFFNHARKGIWSGVQQLHATWGTYRQLKGEDGFSAKTFATNVLPNFKRVGGHFLNALKTGTVAGALWMDPSIFGVGVCNFGTVSLALGGYALYNPIGFRKVVTKVEDWCRPANMSVQSDREIKSLSAWKTVCAIANGSYPLTRIFHMHRIGNLNDQIAVFDDKPRFRLPEKGKAVQDGGDGSGGSSAPSGTKTTTTHRDDDGGSDGGGGSSNSTSMFTTTVATKSDKKED